MSSGLGQCFGPESAWLFRCNRPILQIGRKSEPISSTADRTIDLEIHDLKSSRPIGIVRNAFDRKPDTVFLGKLRDFGDFRNLAREPTMIRVEFDAENAAGTVDRQNRLRPSGVISRNLNRVSLVDESKVWPTGPVVTAAHHQPQDWLLFLPVAVVRVRLVGDRYVADLGGNLPSPPTSD